MRILASAPSGAGAGAAVATVVAGNMGVFVAAAEDGEVGVVWMVGIAARAAEEVEAFVVAGGAGGASVFLGGGEG